jgi:hypothetical protein
MIAMPERQDYRLLIETEWKDIHHSRIQEWSALGIITAAQLGLIQLLKFIYDSQITSSLIEIFTPICCIIAILFSIIGILMVCRHRRLMWIKLNWIYESEQKLGLIKTEGNQHGIIPIGYKMKKISRGYNEILEDEKNSVSKIITEDNKTIWNKLMWPRKLSTSWLMIMIYILLGTIDCGFLVFTIFAIIN